MKCMQKAFKEAIKMLDAQLKSKINTLEVLS